MKISSNLRLILGGIGMSVIIGILVILILNLNQPVIVSQETFNGQPVIVKSCTPIPNLPLNPFANTCLSSTNPSQTQDQTGCGNNGIPINNICPDSVINLPSNTTISNNPTTVQPNQRETIKIIPSVSLIDNSGNTIALQSNPFTLKSFLGNQLSFVSTGSANTPIDHGKVLLSLVIQSSTPNEKILSNGTLFVTINGIQLHQQGLQWATNQMTDINNKVTVNIQTPLGIVQQYALDVAANSQLINQASNILNFTVSNVNIQNGMGQSYKIVPPQVIYSTTLSYDANKVIQSSNGVNIITYPSDDTFTISANSRTVTTTAPPPSCPAGYSAYACGKNVILAPKTVSVTYPSVSAGSATIYLESNTGEKLIGGTSSIGTSGRQTISNIPRDSDIRIVITGGYAPQSQTLHTPVTLKTYAFACTDSGCTLS